jgi:protoporphyrinogen oxidase
VEDGARAGAEEQRIAPLSLPDVALRLAGLRRGGARTYARRYLYPRLGIGEIFERMSAAMVGAGGHLVLGARVTGLSLHEGRVAAVRYRAGDREHELPCDAVISTLALPLLARMVAGGEPPRAIARSIDRLRFRAIRLCNVLLDMPEVSPHTWMYVSEPRYLITRIQEPRQRSPFAAPEGKTSLMLEIPCDVGDAVWNAPDEAIYDRCIDDLAHLGFGGIRAATLDHFSTFVEEGYPIYHLDYRRDRHMALSYIGETPNLVSCGRQGAFRYIFMDTAMEMGMAAAQAILVEDPGRRQAIADLRSEHGLVEARALTA